ncbi:MAG TPA: hypothetical protein V6D16_13315 [Candidatus Obscuribacterales bacterium]
MTLTANRKVAACNVPLHKSLQEGREIPPQVNCHEFMIFAESADFAIAKAVKYLIPSS